MTTTTPISSIEDRLAAIESLLGNQNITPPNSNQNSSGDIDTRLTQLQDGHLKRISTHADGSLQSDLQTCQTYEEEFHPGLLLTHNILGASSSSSKQAPLMYRRQEILASKESFQSDIQHLSAIRDLLLLKSKSSSSENKYANAPIISSDSYTLATDPSNIKRLDKVTHKIVEVQSRASQLGSRLDHLLNLYEKVILAASEKIVLADEELHALETENKTEGQ